MKRKGLYLIVISCFLLLITGCGNNNSTEDDMTRSVHKIENYHTEDNNDFDDKTTESNMINDVETTSIDDNLIEYKMYWFGTFSEGLAWIKYISIEERKSKYYHGVIDKDGNIVFSFECDSLNSHTSLYYNGVSMFDDGWGNLAIYDKSGSVLLELNKSDEVYYYMLAEHNGLFLICKHVTNINENNYYAYIIDDKGNILTEEKLFYKQEYDELHPFSVAEIYDGIIGVRYSGGYSQETFDAIVVNMNSKQIIDTNTLGKSYNNRFGQGYINRGRKYWHLTPEELYSQDSFNEAVKNLEPYSSDYELVAASSNGVLYFENSVIDIQTEEKIYDIPQYGNKQIIECVSEDYVLLNIEGADGKNYYTVLDKNGKALFEPEVVEEGIEKYVFDNGYVLSLNGEYIINPAGEKMSLNDAKEIIGEKKMFRMMSQNHYGHYRYKYNYLEQEYRISEGYFRTVDGEYKSLDGKKEIKKAIGK